MTGIAATCTTTGLTEGKKCSDCYAILIAQAIIPEKPHTESDWIIDIAATTELEGEKHTECTVCGATVRTVAIPCSSSEGLLFRLNSDRKSYTVVGIGTCTDTKLIIPSKYNGLPVTAIGNDFVKGNASIISINIPDSITNIGSNAFSGCTSLTSITIPDSVTSIGQFAFYDCTSLTRICYNGTKAQWNSIRKINHWNISTGNCTIYCTDGNISK